jgi:hypothetical protein
MESRHSRCRAAITRSLHELQALLRLSPQGIEGTSSAWRALDARPRSKPPSSASRCARSPSRAPFDRPALVLEARLSTSGPSINQPQTRYRLENLVPDAADAPKRAPRPPRCSRSRSRPRYAALQPGAPAHCTLPIPMPGLFPTQHSYHVTSHCCTNVEALRIRLHGTWLAYHRRDATERSAA